MKPIFIWADLLPFGKILNPAYPLPRPDSERDQRGKDYQRFVEEVRFCSQLSGPVQFVAGVFYSDLHGAIPFAANYPAPLRRAVWRDQTAAGV